VGRRISSAWTSSTSRPSAGRAPWAVRRSSGSPGRGRRQRARKGIFITTSAFSKEAREYAANIESKIILVDGERLANLMMDYNVGVTPMMTYAVKRVDGDYFQGG
jgi:hypothetical protein